MSNCAFSSAEKQKEVLNRRGFLDIWILYILIELYDTIQVDQYVQIATYKS